MEFGICDCDSMKRNALLYCIVLDEDQSKRLICGEWFDCNERSASHSPPTHALTAQTNASRTATICCHSIRRLPLSTQSQSNLHRMCLFFCLCNCNGNTEPICSRSTHFRSVFCLFVVADAAWARALSTSSELTMDCAIFKTWQIRDFPILLAALNALCLCVCVRLL